MKKLIITNKMDAETAKKLQEKFLNSDPLIKEWLNKVNKEVKKQTKKTVFILKKGNKVKKTSNIDKVKRLKEHGWEVQLSALGELL